MTIFAFKMMAFFGLGFSRNLSASRNLSQHIYLRIFVGAILSARYCLHAIVGTLLSCALLSMNRCIDQIHKVMLVQYSCNMYVMSYLHVLQRVRQTSYW